MIMTSPMQGTSGTQRVTQSNATTSSLEDNRTYQFRAAGEKLVASKNYKGALDAFDRAIEADKNHPSSDNIELASIYVDKMAVLILLKRPEEALRYFDQIEPLVRDRIDNEVMSRLYSRSLNNKAEALERLKRFEDARNCYVEIVNKFKNSEFISIRTEAVRAMNIMAEIDFQNGNYAKAGMAYDEIIRTSSGEEYPPMRQEVRMAIYNRTLVKRELDRRAH